jgi:hypothetical protein
MITQVLKFRKKPIVVEAMQYHPHYNCNAVHVFTHIPGQCDAKEDTSSNVPWRIETEKGILEIDPGAWIIKNSFGEFSSCPSAVFEDTYEPITEETEGTTSERR